MKTYITPFPRVNKLDENKERNFLHRKMLKIRSKELKNDEEDSKLSKNNIKDKSTITESVITNNENSENDEKPVKKLKKVFLKKKKFVKNVEDDEDSSFDKSEVNQEINETFLQDSLNK